MTDEPGTDEPGTDEPGTGEPTPEERRALFRVVRGEPTDAEVAALAVVLAAAASGGADAPPAAGRDPWSDPATRFRVPLVAGPGAWQRTYLPR